MNIFSPKPTQSFLVYQHRLQFAIIWTEASEMHHLSHYLSESSTDLWPKFTLKKFEVESGSKKKKRPVRSVFPA